MIRRLVVRRGDRGCWHCGALPQPRVCRWALPAAEADLLRRPKIAYSRTPCREQTPVAAATALSRRTDGPMDFPSALPKTLPPRCQIAGLALAIIDASVVAQQDGSAQPLCPPVSTLSGAASSSMASDRRTSSHSHHPFTPLTVNTAQLISRLGNDLIDCLYSLAACVIPSPCHLGRWRHRSADPRRANRRRWWSWSSGDLPRLESSSGGKARRSLPVRRRNGCIPGHR
jgi:hypothetical protein